MTVITFSNALYQSKPAKQVRISSEPKLRVLDIADHLAGVALTIVAVGSSASLFWFF